jgi:hypothetical protein
MHVCIFVCLYIYIEVIYNIHVIYLLIFDSSANFFYDFYILYIQHSIL